MRFFFRLLCLNDCDFLIVKEDGGAGPWVVCSDHVENLLAGVLWGDFAILFGDFVAVGCLIFLLWGFGDLFFLDCFECLYDVVLTEPGKLIA